LDDDLMTTHFKLAEHAQLIIFARSPEKKWVHDNVIFRSVYDGQLRLCMSLLCGSNRPLARVTPFVSLPIFHLRIFSREANFSFVIGLSTGTVWN
jgi:hypothetical protein